MKSKRLRSFAAITILIVTTLAFYYYYTGHRTMFTQLKHINLLILIILLSLYALSSLILAVITYYSLAIGQAKIPFKENVLLTCYSSIINFFGPLQSGPGFRVAYLKQRHKISAKNYTFATLIYYSFFALFSAIFLCINVFTWWQTILVLTTIVALSLLVIKSNKNILISNYSIDAVIKLALMTLLQVFIISVIYFVELHSIDKHISFGQAITYTGAANFSLFVSFTPGAIGFRESFLLLSQHLHHINGSQVLAASVIDRTVYIVFLGMLFIFSLVFHFGDRLKIKRISAPSVSKPEI